MTAPASVPQEMMEASFHHCVVSPPRSGTIIFETMKVRMIETIEVSQTSEVKRRLEIHLVGVAILCLGDAFVEEVEMRRLKPAS